MDRIVERLPSPGGFALWLYALAFFVVPALLAYEGFAYILGVVIFAVGVHPYIDGIVAGSPVHFGITWRGRKRVWDFHLSIPSERWVIKLISIGLVTFTMLVVPVMVFVVQRQGVVFYGQIEQQMPAILSGIEGLLEWAHGQLPSLVPEVEAQDGGGWKGISDTIGLIVGDAVKDINALMKSVFGSALGVIGGLVGDWIKLVIAAIIIGTILSGWEKEVKMHRAIIAGGIKDARLRANVLRFGELYQTGVSLFMIGYLEVAVTLGLFFGIAMLILPLGLGLGAILFISVLMGFITAVPKIGGLVGMVVAALLMVTNIEPGLGWLGWTVVSFGAVADVAIRTGLMIAVAKLFGLMEAYSYTPEIIGERLGLTKMQIIATVLTWAIGAGFFGMIWGVLISLAFQAALRLSQEVADAETRKITGTQAEPATE